jgi:mRNA interferase MazF
VNQRPCRGQVYSVDIGHGAEPWLIVSNNQRNRQLDTVLAARVTTTDKSQIPTAVPLAPEDPVVGFVLADDMEQLEQSEIAASRYLGSISPRTVVRVNDALSLALGLA